MNALDRPDTTAVDCCDAAAFADMATRATQPAAVDDLPPADPAAFVVERKDGTDHLDLWVENLHCAACIGKIEGALRADDAVTEARVNMSTRRLHIGWRHGATDPFRLMQTVARLGYPVTPFDASDAATGADPEDKRLLAALAVAGFAAANVMLLSVSIWAGHGSGQETGMGEGTRTLFHWISALIALPAVAFAGQPFFRSAWAALRAGGLNMDVPISLAVVLAAAMSILQTAQGAEHAYFDASVSLLFFLLIGRYLDRRARSQARSSVSYLLGLRARAATVIGPDGNHAAVRARDIKPGMMVHVAAGERVPADGTVANGLSELDTSLISGETMPKVARLGDAVYAGTLNLNAPLTIEVTKTAEGSLLSEIVRLMETAEQGRAKYVRLAERAARIYAPVVHVLAATTFLGWLFVMGAGWQPSLMAAVAVLIITCPCALGLAVPAVQVVASGRLLKAGVLVKSTDGLERLAGVDTVIFDKTGTLTLGLPRLISGGEDREALGLAAALAEQSRHPLAKAVVRAAAGMPRPKADDVAEVPGAGIEAHVDGLRVRLGRADWAGVAADHGNAGGTEMWLVRDGVAPVCFAFEDTLRDDAEETISVLIERGLKVELLSGDRAPAVAAVAAAVGIADWRAECRPDDKVKRLQELAQQGRRVMMVGDGMNDAPALAAGYVSMSPAAAADVSQAAADLVFQGRSLLPVATAQSVAKAATRLVFQNFALAVLYNMIAVPVAAVGLATPLVAAIAMSSSSIVVTLNALRLKLIR